MSHAYIYIYIQYTISVSSLKYSRALTFLFTCVFSFVFRHRMGYNGRSCMLRALCESTQYFNRKKPNMVEQLLITILR